MKKSKLFTAGVLALALVFGLVLAGCQNPSDSDTGTGTGGDGTGTGGSNPFVGTWTGTVTLPDIGPMAVTLTVTNSNWTLTGSEDGWNIADGTYQRSGSNATLMVDGSPAGSASVSGNSLTFNIGDGESGVSGASTKNSGGGNGGGNGDGGDTTTKPGSPSGVSATAQSSSSIKVTWNEVSGAASYKVYYEKGSDDTKLLAGTASGTSYTHTGLDANTTYYYYIKAVNSAGESGYSSFSSAKTPSSSGGGDGGGTTTKPSAPSGVSATAQSSSSIKVTWNTVSGAASYKVYYEKGSDDTKMLADTASGTSYTHTGLDANTTYYYYIKAVNSAGESDYSSYSSAKTPSSSGGGGGSTTKPSAPTGVKATVQSPNSIQITWNAVSGADTYYVYSAKSSSGSKTLLTPFGISNTTFTDTQLTASTTYYYWVKAENSADESGYSSSASATTATLLPNTPYGSPQVKSPTKNSLTIQWNGSLSATSYKLYRSTSYSGPFTAAVYTGSSTSYTDTGLSAGTTYYYKVTAVNSAGESDFSEVAQGTTTN